jgi:hypothetical protein
MCKQKVVCYNIWLRGGVAFLTGEQAKGERASPWRIDSLVVSANWLDVRLVNSAPVLHSVTKVLEAHIRIRCEVLSASSQGTYITQMLVMLTSSLMEVVAG